MCTVRAVVKRELHRPEDLQLLCLERMRLLDMVHYWSVGTHTSYQSKLRMIDAFSRFHQVPILEPTTLLRPPVTADIPLMWCQEAYSLKEPSARRAREGELFVSFDTTRQLRAAASQFFAWDINVSRPGEAYMNREKRIIQLPCRSTDSLGYTLHAGGMSSRVGTHTRPSAALLDRHIRFLDNELDTAYLLAVGRNDRKRMREVAKAGLANLQLWLAWLRSMECFQTEVTDVLSVHPSDGASLELPPGSGMVAFKLLPETKTSRTNTVDVIVAYKTLSGLHPGKWWERVCASLPTGTTKLYVHDDGSAWTSEYFRHTWLYPSLKRQRTLGDALLMAFDDQPGNTIEDKFWSLHCYRRGGRSHVNRPKRQKRSAFGAPTPDQIYMHGRWTRRRANEPIDRMYQEWTPRDRVKLTFYHF